ncbi:diguanylate cyclase [Lacibacterium aquatile]|uniref:diguanylate cyclase n=1 Tax=Lacibacterium aquatile TaxID=1168082 RepID=A0ABW5DYY0_9PROT
MADILAPVTDEKARSFSIAEQDDRKLVRRLTFSYVAALTLIAVLSALVHLLLDNIITQQSSSGSVIKVAQRQITQTQRVTKAALDWTMGGRPAARQELADAVKLMAASNEVLTGRSASYGFQVELSSAMHGIFFESPVALDNEVKRFVYHAEALLDTGNDALNRAIHLQVMREAASGDLLHGLDRAVSQFELEASERVESLRDAQKVVLVILLLTLAAEAFFIFRPLVNSVQLYAQRLLELATRDALTGLHNRRHFFELGQREFDRSRRASKPCALLLFDIDHFKAVNDTYGHATGDDVIRGIAEIACDMTRRTDIAARVGGEEFVILLPDTGLEAAALVGEKLRRAIEAAPYGTRSLHATVSIGIAEAEAADVNLSDTLARADIALYQAKREGRNRLVQAADSPAV